MTVSYSREVAKRGTGVFLRLLGRWKGSIYKIVWVELLIYLIIYYCLNLIYLYCLDEQYGRKHFIIVVTYFSKYGSSIPLSFVLGFYVNLVFNRWWSQFCTIPDPDKIAILVGASISGQEDKPRMIRRTIIRYVCAAFTITLTMISPKVKKRFPTFNHFVQAGLLNLQEKKLFEELDNEYPGYTKYWLPLAWAANVSERARSEGIVKDEMGLKDIIEAIDEFRDKCKRLCDYDWICIPLVYTQVVTLAVYLYFLFTVIGSQFIEEETDGDIFTIFKFPFMSCVEFFFYMGWLKVAERLINPFGDDDDDFELNYMIDRHLQVGYLLVDKIHNEHPRLSKDPHWDQIAPNQLPFTIATKKYMVKHPVESTSHIHVDQKDQDFLYKEDIIGQEEGEALINTGSSFSKIFSRKTSKPEYNLKRVTLKTNMDDEDWDEFNFFEDETTKNADNFITHHVANTEVFDSLKEERLEKRKEALLKCLKILKDEIFK